MMFINSGNDGLTVTLPGQSMTFVVACQQQEEPTQQPCCRLNHRRFTDKSNVWLHHSDRVTECTNQHNQFMFFIIIPFSLMKLTVAFDVFSQWHHLCRQVCVPEAAVSHVVGVDLHRDAESWTSPYGALVWSPEAMCVCVCVFCRVFFFVVVVLEQRKFGTPTGHTQRVRSNI